MIGRPSRWGCGFACCAGRALAALALSVGLFAPSVGRGLAAASLEVVINEIHYNPAGGLRGGEFVELLNHGDEPAAVGGWLLLGGVTFVLPAGTTIPPDGFLVIAGDASALRGTAGLDESVVVGEFTGRLSDGGEAVSVWTPEGYRVSAVEFGDDAPWPESADGLGPSLERLSPLREGSDPGAWAASVPVGGTPGRSNSVRVADREGPPPVGGRTEIRLVPPGAEWHFFRGTEEPPPDWASIAFDASSWERGPAGFGYGDGDDATVLDDMEGNYTSVYIRHEFRIDDPTELESLRLTVLFDDAFVAYLNGVEVERFNIELPPETPPDAPVPFDAGAEFAVSDFDERIVDLSASLGDLLAGDNVLALQGVNISPGSSDLSLHPSLAARLGAGASADEVLVPPGAIWRYRPGIDEPPDGWTAIAYDASEWPSGPAGFGYGDEDDATVLEEMQGGYVTLCVRRQFSVVQRESLEELRLLIDYDDGFTAYINGVPVASANVEETGWDQPASGSREAGQFEALDIPVDALVEGVNVLAVQGHNADVDSSDFSLSAYLVATRRDPGEPGEPPDDLPDDPLPPAPRDLVVNEIAPESAGDGWIELYNASGSDLDVSGRRVVAWTPERHELEIADDTVIPAGGRFVVTEAQLGFELEDVVVVTTTTPEGWFVDGLNPRMGPIEDSEGESSGRFPDGSDNRLVFASSTRGTANSVDLEDRVVIHEIHYHPAPLSGATEFVELHNRGESPVSLDGWAFTRGIDFAFEGVTIDAGGFVVVARDPGAVQTHYGISGVLGPYDGGLRGDAETLLLRDARGNPADRVRYADEGSWPESADGTGPSLELVHPSLENRWGPAWAASEGEGTPGAANSMRDDDPAPIVVGVSHAPVVPTPGDAVRVLARVSDETGIDAVTLFHERDGDGGEPDAVPMLDDGVVDDGVARNGVYGAMIPARADRTVVAFWIRAEAVGGRSVTVPEGQPERAFLYQVEEPAEGVLDRPLYRIVMRGATLREFLVRNPRSDQLLDLTFVAADRAYYNRGIRNRGSSARRCDPLSYRVQFDHDRDFEGAKRLNINGCSVERQWLGLDFLSRTGIATPHGWFRRLAFNGDVHPDPYIRVEAIDRQFLERALSDDDDGNLYRGRGRADLDYRGEEFDPYRPHYEKRTHVASDDFSDVADLCFRFDRATTSDEDFPGVVQDKIDHEEWALFFAAFAALGSTENSILLDNGDDYFLYHGVVEDRWLLLPWDLDSCFDEADQELFRPSVDSIRRFLQHPRFAPLYWCRLAYLLDFHFAPEVIEARLAHLVPLVPAAGIAELADYAVLRRQFVNERIPRTLEGYVVAGGSACEGSLLIDGGRIDLAGEAPVCGTSAVLVNGVEVEFDPVTGAWQGSIESAGLTGVEIVAVDAGGEMVARLEWTLRNEDPFTGLPPIFRSSVRLNSANSPYRVTAETVIASGVTLTIEPGVVVAFTQGARFEVEGTLEAVGTAAEPIVLRADDCAPSWRGLVFRPGSTGSRIEHCRFEACGPPGDNAAAIVVVGADVALARIDLPSVAEGGVLGMLGADVRVEDSTVSASEWALAVTNAQLDAQRCLVRQSAIGVLVFESAIASLAHLTCVDNGLGILLAAPDGANGPPSAVAHSSIIAGSNPSIVVRGGGALDLTWSDTTDTLWPGEGNIAAAPEFIDAAGGDYRLSWSSPCAGTGRDGSDMGAFAALEEPSGNRFVLCDANGDGDNNLSDAIFTLNWLFGGGADVRCVAALNCDGDHEVTITDAIYNLAFQFTGGPAPRAPYPDCEEAEMADCAVETCRSVARGAGAR